MSPSTSTLPTTPPLTLERLGVRPMINCWGTYTIISGSRLVPQAAAAMLEATNHYVHMEELMEAAGRFLAELTGADWGLVTCGCAAAISQITAACIAGADPEKMARLPDSTGMRNEIISQRAHRQGYDRAMRDVGGRMIEVVTVADLRAAINERTAMLAITGDSEAASTIPVERMIAIGKEHGIPCFVDAAAQPLRVPNRYLEMGADAVAFSGGKCLRAPQASGLLLGRKDLLQAAYLNAAPHHGIGRPMKAGKEEIMALLAAVEAFVRGRDHAAEWRMWEGWLETIRAAIADLPTMRFELRRPGIANVAPTLYFGWDPAILGVTPEQVHSALLEGEPRIIVQRLEGGLGIMPYMMEAGDAEIVAPLLRAALSTPQAVALADNQPPAADLSGPWQIHIRYLVGEAHHAMTLRQAEDGALSGDYHATYEWTTVAGAVAGQRVTLRTVLGLETTRDAYVFKGALEGDELVGTLTFGGRWQATWRATRG
jgi:L-seryl-tRNA(Ser) seleniumtransferase